MRPNTTPEPTQVDSHSPTEMLLAWNTRESFALPYAELRYQCPCASCVDEHTGQRIIKKENVASDIRPKGAQAVGRYALSIQWSDGHSTGIYHFDRLYELCKRQGHPV